MRVRQARAAARERQELGVEQHFVDHPFLVALALQQFGEVRLLCGVLQFSVDAVQQHRDSGPDNFEVAQLLGGDVHQQVVFVGVGLLGGERLDEILHGCFQLAVATAELLEQHPGEHRVGS